MCVVWTHLNASTLTHGPIGPIARLTGACCRVGAESTSATEESRVRKSSNSSHQEQSTYSDRRVDAGRSNCEVSDRQHVAPQGLG